MANREKIDLKIKINRGRYNLIFLVITSVINIFTISSGSSLILPYSSSISNYAVAFGIGGNDTVRILGLIIACAVLLALMICYLLSKTKPMYLIIALSLVIADTIALFTISLSNGEFGNLFNVLDVLIHITIVIYLVKAIKAYSSLLSLGGELIEEEEKNEPINDNSQPCNQDYSHNEEYEEEEEEKEDSDESEQPENKPIRKYIEKDCPPLVSGNTNGLQIFAIIFEGTAELVINGYVCDELDVTYLSEFQLRAIVNNIDIIFDYRRSYDGETMFLYADDELLDSLGRS